MQNETLLNFLRDWDFKMMNFWQIRYFEAKKSAGAPIAPLIMLLLLYISLCILYMLWTVLMILFEYLAELANCKFSLKIIWVAGFFFVCPNNIDRLGVGKSLVIISLYSFYQLDGQRTLKSHKLSLCGLLNNTLVIHTMIINSTTAIASSLFDYLYDNTLQYIHRY